jgi:hypothetical protein
MSGTRPSLFEDEPDIDLSRFAPRAESESAPPPETVRQISEEGGFPSRAPVQVIAEKPAPADRTRLQPRYRTGRTVLLNARITQRAHDRFHEIVEAERIRYESGEIMHRVTLGEIVERALAALDRELVGMAR